MGEYAAVKTSVWWDIENCAVPRSCDPQLIVQNMSSALATAGYRGPISVSAYGDTHQIAHNVQHALSSTGVSLHHVPAGIKDASDKKILVDMLFWAIDNPPPANYLLISGDRDFSHAIHKLKMRRYNILLAQPPNVSQTLTAAAKSVWLWKSLVAGEPPLEQSPYISSTSCGNKDDLATSRNIVSRSLDVTQDANPEVQNILCDRQSGSNGMADKKCEVKRPREMETDNVSKPASKKQLKKMSGLANTSTKQTAVKKPTQGQLKAVKGQGLICYKCGDGHRAAECTFSGDCHGCGRQGHKDRVCKVNPNSVVKWQPAHAQDLVTPSPGSVSRQAAPHVPSPPPASPVAAASPQTTAETPSGPTSTPPRECFLQETPAVSTPPPASAAPVPPHTGVSDFSAPAHSGVYAMPTAVSMGKPDVVTQQTSSAPHPPTAVLAHRPMAGPGQYHQVGASRPFPAWTPPPWCFLQAPPAVLSPPPAPVPPHTGDGKFSAPAHSGVYTMSTAVSLGKPDVMTQRASSAPHPPTAVLAAHRSVTGQYNQVGASQLQPASSAPRPPTAVLAHQSAAGQYHQVGASQLHLASSAPHPPTAVLAHQPVAGQYHQVGASQLHPAWTFPPGYFWQAMQLLLQQRRS
ncbi:WW domain-binding protein 11-like isoform X1 [Triticum urartu]|uniref:WW domain-binding protein 11-like isoform X1 n=1 Tax=Triticum urartu TaxID=4572 RepID=UPI002043CF37|nr:WW domain-binding protein 11-like isoform X1 [Triticum urartu]XP_048555113.1 WW domain-binding protein 11-like isoform X1 [Triticum urartu]XP_048555114.1 WW domain-binding protein 11-like isoform X1 [Triticum urartu]XP_048555115.1 WW domain-binding protein 11-like isoform X1 [Triticum urartu]XP_048555116.1 WW domain-binding protein 11-like isoform X1 [Triticum urartu]XP_048555117.1 WW domain-binding protein 11-like isoform X1 [Triticum urartu]XP_048555119.1 WW domain-binding protein 11-lik